MGVLGASSLPYSGSHPSSLSHLSTPTFISFHAHSANVTKASSVLRPATIDLMLGSQ